ncbi:MAG: CAP domain-containing protein [Lachnospiraceae bacterium]|nr:CAP domain-containing protein [Lachnospiraceae bacterium]
MKKSRLLAALMTIVMAVSVLPARASEDMPETGVSEEAAYCEDNVGEDVSYEAVIAGEGSGTEIAEILYDEEDSIELVNDGFDTASNTYEFKYGQTEARKMLSRINSFRKSDEAWYWSEDDSEKVKAAGLADYTYDYGLEKIAMLRAVEIVQKFSHTRPNGGNCFSAWAELGYEATGWRGENIAYGYSTEEEVFIGWREDDDKYAGQGHRRNMLSSNFKYIGIGHVIYKGTHYWVQDFGSVNTGEAENTAADGDYKAVIDEYGKVTITGADSTDPEDPKPDDPDDPKPDEDNPLMTVTEISLVNKEKYDLSALVRAQLGNAVPIAGYKTDKKSVAAINKDGIITGKNSKKDEVKSTYVYAYVRDGRGRQVLAGKIKVSVYKPVFKFTQAELTHSGMSLDACSFITNIPEGKSIRFTIPESKQQIMTVNENTGLITAGDKSGSVKISAYIGTGDKAAKYTAELKVKIPKLKETITIKNGKNKKLTLKNVSSFNKDKIQWSVEGSAVSLTPTKKNNIVKLSTNSVGTATVKAVLDGAEYKTVITVE